MARYHIEFEKMRVPTVRILLLSMLSLASALAGTASAEPTVRWINRFGDGVTTPLKRVVEEKATEVLVETATGEKKTIPVWRLIWLEREDENVASEAALLGARRDVRVRYKLTDAIVVLDKIAKNATGWQKEYALAARAVAAVLHEEKNAVPRGEAFMKAFPESRFRGVVTRWLTHATIKTGMTRNEAFNHYESGYELMGRMGAPLLERSLMWRQCGALFDLGSPRMAKVYMQNVEGGMRKQMEKHTDLAHYAMVLAAPGYVGLDAITARRRSASNRGERPIEAMYRAGILQGRVGLALEELRCDVWCEMARLHAALGEADKCAKAWKKAADLAVSIGDRARASVIAAESGRSK